MLGVCLLAIHSIRESICLKFDFYFFNFLLRICMLLSCRILIILSLLLFYLYLITHLLNEFSKNKDLVLISMESSYYFINSVIFVLYTCAITTLLAYIYCFI